MTQPYESELTARFGFDLDLGGEAEDDPWIRQVLLRRTQRRYSDRPVPELLVRLILAAAFSASSKSDFQQASVIRVEDRAQRDKLAALIPDMPWIGNAPVFLVFLGDARRLERVAEHPVANGTLEGFFNATVDAALALADLHPRRRDPGPRHLPDQRPAQPHRRGRRDPGAARQGVPGRRAVPRLSGAAGLHLACACRPSATVHRDRYDDGAIAAVDAYDRRRDARHSLKDRQKSPEIFGTAEFYGWSEDKARQAMTPGGRRLRRVAQGARLRPDEIAQKKRPPPEGDGLFHRITSGHRGRAVALLGKDLG